MDDKKTIGLTPEGDSIMQVIMDTNYFKDKIDAAKLAMSLAINAGFQPSQVERASTIWNVGSFDSDGQLKHLISILYADCQTPYRYIENLIDAGLKIAKSKLDSGNFDVAALMDS